MGFIIGTPIIAIIIGILVAVRIGNIQRDKSKRTAVTAGISVFLIVCLVSLVFASFQQVRQATVGVVTVFGKIQDDVLSAGLHFVLPWAQVHEVPVGVQVMRVEKAEASSKDLQNVFTTITVNFRVSPDKARALFAMSPSLSYERDYLLPAAYETFKNVTSHYVAEELVTRRTEVSESIMQNLQIKLKQYGVDVRDMNITNFDFSPEFNKAIEAKVTAGQYAEKASRDLQRIQIEAQQKIAEAEGQAKAIAIQSKAIQENGGAQYIQLQAINKWDGKLPAYMSPNAALPFVGASANSSVSK